MTRPNVLLVSVDHWPGRLFRTLGHPAILSPTLDQLAANGVIFPNAYSTTPTCIPARREIHTGTFARTHGDRVFNETLPMAELPTLAQTFRDAGYQAYAVGKLHVYPQRDRIGFDEAIINEEGRHHLGLDVDDYELFLAEQGYPGQELAHGMGNNSYVTRPWHLPEYCHPTNWTVREMSKVIARRDPTRPAFWFMSFNHPHPPLTPLNEYLEMYRQIEIDMPHVGEWARDLAALPYALQARTYGPETFSETEIRFARQAFYALCTHIDHQLRLSGGLLREAGLVDDTVVLVTGDHGDMLGNHGFYEKALLYDDAAKIPMILVPHAGHEPAVHHKVDDRLVVQADIMPTLLELCDIAVPTTVEGSSLLGEHRREHVYGEHWEDAVATRMVRDTRHKLIYYPVGNRYNLFDLQNDPDEMRDLSEDPAHASVREDLTRVLVQHLYGSDLEWLDGDELVGLPDIKHEPQPERGMHGQRGWRFMQRARIGPTVR